MKIKRVIQTANLTVLGLVLMLAYWAEAAQIESYITLSVDRTNSPYHRVGISGRLLRAIGGVQSQGVATVGLCEDDHIRLYFQLESGSYPGYLNARLCGTEAKVLLPYDELVPLVLFVDSGGTSLYTAFDLDAEFMKNAGFVKHKEGGLVALELKGTRFEEAVSSIDFCEHCLSEDTDDELREAISPRAETERGNIDYEEGSYINTDLGIPHIVTVEEGEIAVSGGIARYHWKSFSLAGSDADVAITEVNRLVRPTRKLLGDTEPQTIQERISFLEEQRNELEIDYLKAPFGSELEDQLETEINLINGELEEFNLPPGFELFESLSLLRNAKGDDREWSRFIESVRRHASHQPEPWIQFTDAYCSLYPERPDC